MINRHSSIERQLREEDRPAFEALARTPGMTIDALWEWLNDQGYQLSRASVGRWRKNFDEALSAIRGRAELAKTFADAARAGGGGGLSEAALLRFQQLLLEKLFDADAEALSSQDVLRLAQSLRGVVGSQREIESLREEMQRRQSEAVAQAQAAAASGRSASDVVATIKEALGIG